MPEKVFNKLFVIIGKDNLAMEDTKKFPESPTKILTRKFFRSIGRILNISKSFFLRKEEQILYFQEIKYGNWIR